MSAHSHSGHVYFAACGKYVKIGFTSQVVKKRIASLPGKIKLPADFDRADTVWLMHSIPGCVMRDESRLHGLFLRHHAEGEWFNLTLAFIAQLADLEYLTYREERLAMRRARADLRRAGIAAYARPADGKPGHGPVGLRLLDEAGAA